MRTFIKFILVVALAVGLVFELGSPLWTRSEAAGAANDAASAAARDYFTSNSLAAAKSAAVAAAAVRGATVTKVLLQADGSVKVTVTRHAKSYVLYHISALKNWYNVTASASATPAQA